MTFIAKEPKQENLCICDLIAFLSHRLSRQGYNKANLCGSWSALFNVIKIMSKEFEEHTEIFRDWISHKNLH